MLLALAPLWLVARSLRRRPASVAVDEAGLRFRFLLRQSELWPVDEVREVRPRGLGLETTTGGSALTHRLG